jgi:pimeloyl-[acyl-carrier protein] methyl ester esterase
MITRLVLLPGMDGTGELFSDFMKMMPRPTHIQTLCYPADASPSYGQLLKMVQFMVPASEPYFLLAESYSTPLAIQFAATNPPNLKGLILCAGFATNPIRGWRKLLASLIPPLAFLIPLPKMAMSRLLLGPDAPESLHASVRAAIRSVKPAVLTERLLQILEVDARPVLSQVSVPILYIQGAQDRLVNASSFTEIRAIRPQTKIVRIDGPHLIVQREPGQCAKAVAEFIETIG